MVTWITENLSTLIVSAVLIAAVAAIIISMIRNRKKQGSSCGCGCTDCSLRSACHPDSSDSAKLPAKNSDTPQ